MSNHNNKQQKNPCKHCFSNPNNDCCVDVYIILNPEELHLFNKFKGFTSVEGGGIFYTDDGCPYFDLSTKDCGIHDHKPPPIIEIYRNF